MSCIATRPGPIRCPSADEIMGQLLALLPQGRAWQTREGGPLPPRLAAFDLEMVQEDAFQTTPVRDSILWRYWRAFAEVLAAVNARACDLLKEFFCASQSETRDQWMAEYGLPDDCEPFPDLCTKVAALGGVRCEYFAALAARIGWSITCEERFNECGSYIGNATIGCMAPANARRQTLLIITVFVTSSPAYSGRRQVLPYVGKFSIGQSLACDPDITSLRCLLDRVVQAHITLDYQTVFEA